MSSPSSNPQRQSLEQAMKQADQRLRWFNPSVGNHLDEELSLSIEINGVHVARIECMDSALEELAGGWAFMHHFCETPDDLHRVTVSDNRASIMVRGGVDILELRGVLHGENPERHAVPNPWPADDDWNIPEDVLLDVLREAWQAFRDDRMGEGSVHAALVSNEGVDVVAFDISASQAVCKVLGWSLRENAVPSSPILVVNGLITRLIVDAAARIGVQIIATPFIPTANAYRAARVVGVTIVGYIRHQIVGVFGGSSVIVCDDNDEAGT